MAMERQRYELEVEGIGRFLVLRREMRESMRILAEYSRLTEGQDDPAPVLDVTADVLSTLRVLTVEAPAGWDLDGMDPLDRADFSRMLAVVSAMREKEQFFRRGPAAQGAADGPATGAQPGVVDTPAVPAASD